MSSNDDKKDDPSSPASTTATTQYSQDTDFNPQAPTRQTTMASHASGQTHESDASFHDEDQVLQEDSGDEMTDGERESPVRENDPSREGRSAQRLSASVAYAASRSISPRPSPATPTVPTAESSSAAAQRGQGTRTGTTTTEEDHQAQGPKDT